MNELPIELILHIYEYLDLFDLSNCKLINKKFYKCVKEFRIKELSCFYSLSHWFYINKPMNFNYNLKNYPKLSFSKCLLIFNLQFLKYLSVFDLTLSDLNKFQNLEVLHIYLLLRSENYTNSKLSLKNLKILQINNSQADFNIQIDTPKLIAVGVCGEINKLIFNYPHTIKYLKINWRPREILQFDSLKDPILWLTKLDLSELQNLSKLKKISIENTSQDRTQLSNLIRQKRRLRRADLEIYCRGIQIESMNSLEHIDYDDYNHFRFEMKNYENLIDVLDWVDRINYNELMNLVEQVPVDFHKKYCNIKFIFIDGKVKDQNNLIQFISKCQVLNGLQIKNSNLNQKFFNQLPSISSLTELIIEEEEDSNCGLNFDFIFRMFHLQYLDTNFKISDDVVENVDKLKFFEGFNFEERGRKNRIQIFTVTQKSVTLVNFEKFISKYLNKIKIHRKK